MADFINSVDVLGDDAVTDALIDKSIVEYHDDGLTDVGDLAFHNCSKLTSINVPAATRIGDGAFEGCSALTHVNFPAVASVNGNAFSGCTKLTRIDFPAISAFGGDALKNCTALRTLILRNTAKIATLGNYSALYSTAISKGTGYIYVPTSLLDSYKTATNWSTYAGQIRAIEEYPEFCELYTWPAVAAAVADGTYASIYRVGDTIPVDLGSYGVHDMEIVAFDTDEKADGSKAAITWLSKDLITHRRMNSTDTTTGGWEAAELRGWLQTDLYATLPDEVKSAIVTVKKTYYDYINATQTCEDNIWIPSSREMFGNRETSGATYTSYFTDDASRVKYYNGSARSWWMRSAMSRDSFRVVSASGESFGGTNAASSCRVAIGFCT